MLASLKFLRSVRARSAVASAQMVSMWRSDNVVTETTALGAAYLAGLAVGFWKNMEAIQEQWQADKKFSPAMNNETRIKLSKDWQRSVKAAKAWADE